MQMKMVQQQVQEKEPAPIVKLFPEQESAARKKLVGWLFAWEKQAWGTMASHCQSSGDGVGEEVETCKKLQQGLEDQHLKAFVVGELIRGRMDVVKQKPIGYADFNVVVLIHGNRIGIRPRLVFNGKRWGVNFTSINRRFDPDKEA